MEQTSQAQEPRSEAKPGSTPKLTLPSYVDSSLLSTWRSCRRKFFWSTLNSLYPTGKSIHLIAGGALAAGMEAARRLAFTPGAGRRPSHSDLVRAAYKAYVVEWGDNPTFEGEAKAFENTFAALVVYLEQHPPETDIIQPLIRSANGAPSVEYTFAIPLEEGPRHPETGEPFFLAGRFDLLGSYAGLPCVVDEKTTYAIGYRWDDQWDLRGQFMGYIWACQHYGYDCHTAVIRGIGIQKREIKIATSIKQFAPYMIQRWYRLLLHDLCQIVDAYTSLKNGSDLTTELWFPYNFSDACNAYGGCAYTTLCSAHDPEAFFTNYHHYRWNPLAKQPLEVET